MGHRGASLPRGLWPIFRNQLQGQKMCSFFVTRPLLVIPGENKAVATLEFSRAEKPAIQAGNIQQQGNVTCGGCEEVFASSGAVLCSQRGPDEPISERLGS